MSSMIVRTSVSSRPIRGGRGFPISPPIIGSLFPTTSNGLPTTRAAPSSTRTLQHYMGHKNIKFLERLSLALSVHLAATRCVRFRGGPDSCTAAIGTTIRSPRRQRQAATAARSGPAPSRSLGLSQSRTYSTPRPAGRLAFAFENPPNVNTALTPGVSLVGSPTRVLRDGVRCGGGLAAAARRALNAQHVELAD
jgi:hypothetical protein